MSTQEDPLGVDIRPYAQRVALVLGVLEILAGTGFLYLGCQGWIAGDSGSNVAGTMLNLCGLVGFILPGTLLCFPTPARWIGQVLPVLVVGGYLVALLLR